MKPALHSNLMPATCSDFVPAGIPERAVPDGGAFQLAKASALAPIVYTRLIVAVAAGYIMFSEIPDLWTRIGFAIIITSIGYNNYRERQLARQGAAMPHNPKGVFHD